MNRSCSRMIQQSQFNRFLEKPKISDLDGNLSKRVFELLGVNQDEDDNLRIFDKVEEDSLILVHYLEPNEQNKHIRGIVIDIENEEIVAKSFPYTEELLPEEAHELKPENLCNGVVTKAYEGTIIRVFQGKITKNWYLSTHRKINGRRSHWAGPTFGEIFDSVWGDENFSDYFEPGNCYIFLLSHIDNRLVCEVPETQLYYLQTIEKGSIYSNPLKKDHPNVKYIEPEEIKPENLTKLTSELDWRKYSGLLITFYTVRDDKRTIDRCVKLVSPEYQNRRKVRGNEPNFRLRYLQLRQNDEEDLDVSSIRELFPEKEETFKQVEEQLKELPTFLSDYYTERYVNRNFTILPKETHILLENTKNNFDPRVSIVENIRNNLENSYGRYINAMIRFMLQEKRMAENNCDTKN